MKEPTGTVIHNFGRMHDGCGGEVSSHILRQHDGSQVHVTVNADGSKTYDHGGYQQTYAADGFQYDCEGRRIQPGC